MNYLKLSTLNKSEPTGFNLLETLFASVLVGVIAAVGIPYFFKSLELQNLKGASSDIYQAISQAQARSIQRKEDWQFSIKVNSGIVQYAYHPTIENPSSSTKISWSSLQKQIQIDSETNIPQYSSIYQLCFNSQGLPTTIQVGPPRVCTNPPSFTPVQITLNNTNTNASSYKRCVVISTLLGALKTGQEQSVTQNSKYCY